MTVHNLYMLPNFEDEYDDNEEYDGDSSSHDTFADIALPPETTHPAILEHQFMDNNIFGEDILMMKT